MPNTIATSQTQLINLFNNLPNPPLTSDTLAGIFARNLSEGKSSDEIAGEIFNQLPSSKQTPQNRAEVEQFTDKAIEEIAANQQNVNSADGEFEGAIKIVLDSEGGFGNHPQDNGGKTKFGISQKAYPNLDIKNLTREEAKQIYRRDYWEKSGADKLASPMNLIVFDTAVNMGVGRAREFLKKSEGDPATFLKTRENFYREIVSKKPSQKVFLRGWLNRIESLRQGIGINNE